MPAEKTTRKQVLKTGFFKHLQNTDSLTVIQRLIFINFQTAPVFEQTAKNVLYLQCQSERNANQMVNKAGRGIQKVQLFYRRRQQKSSSSAPQGSSIMTTGGHNRRPAPVIY